MPIRVNDLQAALDKLNESQAGLKKTGEIMDQISGMKFKTAGDMASLQRDVAAEINAQAQDAMKAMADMQDGINTQALANVNTWANIQARIGSQTLAGVKTFLAAFEESRRRQQELLDHYRPLAYALITPEHLTNAIDWIDWTAFMAAQRPSLTEQEEATDDPHLGPLIADRSRLAITLKSRLKEREIQERAATELLAYAWSTWGSMWENATIDDMLERFLPDAKSWAALSRQVLEPDYLRKILRGSNVPAQTMRPAYDENGFGELTSDGITNGTRRALLGESLWRAMSSTSRPEMSYSLGKHGGYAHYTIDSVVFPAPKDAFAVVRRYGLGHLDVFHYILELWLANRDKERRGPFDGIYFGIEKFLDDRNVARHKNGYHKPENIEDVVSQVQALEHLMVSGSVPQPNKRSKQPPLKVSAHIVNITHWVTQPRLDGTEKYVACYVRPGDWAAQMQDMSPQFAIAMISVLQLNNKNQYLQKQIALYLLEQFKIRSSYGTFSNPFYVETLLVGACIPIDRKNPARFRSRVEAALNDLAKLDPPVFKSWHYVDQLPNGGHGMLDKWLQTRIRFVPTQQLKQEYASIQDNRQAKIEQNRKRTKSLNATGELQTDLHP